MELIPTAISAGYAAGLNAYGTVLLLGLLGRAGFGEVPEELTRDGVIIGAGVLYAIEFVTDNLPYIDNAWDVLHTAIRPRPTRLEEAPVRNPNWKMCASLVDFS